MLLQTKKIVLPSVTQHLREKTPRKNSEQYYDTQARIDSETPIVTDQWLYAWNSMPPESFIRHKTIFRQCTPSDIDRNGWILLKPTVKELADVFGVPMPKIEEDKDLTMFQWLSLGYEDASNYPYWKRPCFMGIYGDEYVVAASRLSHKRPPFIPFNLYTRLQENSQWKNLRCRASYRHFQARFHAGYSFYMEQQNLFCSVSYGVNLDIHRRGFLWAVIAIDGTFIPLPDRILFSSDLSDLPDKVMQLNARCQHFIQQLGAAWLKEHGREEIYPLVRRLVQPVKVPTDVLNTLRNDPRLDKCHTRFDILRLLMQTMNYRTDEDVHLLIPLVLRFVH